MDSSRPRVVTRSWPVTVVYELRRVRTYYWGAIYALDSWEDDFDAASISDAGPVWAKPRWITINVLNSRSVDSDAAAVEMILRVQDEPAAASDHEEIIDLPSGVLTIGDAGDNDNIELHPGRWRMQITLNPPGNATMVQILLSPFSLAGRWTTWMPEERL